MATVFATNRYERDAKRLLTERERADVRDAIASNPERHPVVPGTGGLRKARWSRHATGKSGGVRVSYLIYAKNEQADMSAADRKVARTFVEELKRAKKEHERR